MDTRAVESVLTEVAKAFRLCRFYPASHPAVQQAMTDLAAALPALAPVGAVELRIGPAGFALGTTPLLPHNPPIQEFANLLFARGHRSMTVQQLSQRWTEYAGPSGPRGSRSARPPLSV